MGYYLIPLFLVLGVAMYFDLRYHKLPNWLTMGGLATGFLYHLIASGLDGLLYSVIGMLVGGGIFMVLYLFKAIGAGDVKLFASIGAIVGTEMVLYTMMYSIVYAGLIGILILLFTKTFLKRMTAAVFEFIGSALSRDWKGLEEYKKTKSIRFPFMYAVLPGVLTAMYYMFLT
jgi:prepilin peptidase CpaA